MAKLVEWMTEPEGVTRLLNMISKHPIELYAAQQDYPADYLAAWDRATALGARLVGVAANDCHHNQVFEVTKIDDDSVRLGTIVDADEEMTVFTTATRPGLRQMVANRDPGEVVARLDFDPYWVSMRFVSTHILAPKLEEAAVRAAVAAGHVYVSHDWIADPSGFRFYAPGDSGKPDSLMGDELEWRPGLRAVAELPLAARVRLLRDGVEVAAEPRSPPIARTDSSADSTARASIASRPGSRSAASGGPGSIRTRSTCERARRATALGPERAGTLGSVRHADRARRRRPAALDPRRHLRRARRPAVRPAAAAVARRRRRRLRAGEWADARRRLSAGRAAASIAARSASSSASASASPTPTGSTSTPGSRISRSCRSPLPWPRRRRRW